MNAHSPDSPALSLDGRPPFGLARCPICNAEYDREETAHCFTCGWDLTPLPELPDPVAADLLRQRHQAQTEWARELWAKTQLQAQLSQVRSHLKHAHQERRQLHVQLDRLQQDLALEREAARASALAGEAAIAALNRIQQQLDAMQSRFDALDRGREADRDWLAARLEGRVQGRVAPEAGEPFADSDSLGDRASAAPPAVAPAVARRLSPPLPPEDDDEERTQLQVLLPDDASPLAAASEPPLPSEGVDYGRLAALLAEGKWLEADRETTRLMLLVAGREKSSWLRIEDVEKFSPRDLKTINELWVKHSDGHFGFSVQHRLWREILDRTNNAVEAWCHFGDRLGWHRSKTLSFSLKAPAGHLPFCSSVGIWWCSGLFPQLLANCQI